MAAAAAAASAAAAAAAAAEAELLWVEVGGPAGDNPTDSCLPSLLADDFFTAEQLGAAAECLDGPGPLLLLDDGGDLPDADTLGEAASALSFFSEPILQDVPAVVTAKSDAAPRGVDAFGDGGGSPVGSPSISWLSTHGPEASDAAPRAGGADPVVDSSPSRKRARPAVPTARGPLTASPTAVAAVVSDATSGGASSSHSDGWSVAAAAVAAAAEAAATAVVAAGAAAAASSPPPPTSGKPPPKKKRRSAPSTGAGGGGATLTPPTSAVADAPRRRIADYAVEVAALLSRSDTLLDAVRAATAEQASLVATNGALRKENDALHRKLLTATAAVQVRRSLRAGGACVPAELDLTPVYDTAALDWAAHLTGGLPRTPSFVRPL